MRVADVSDSILVEDEILKEQKKTNALLRRIINQLGAQHIKRMEFYKEWREHIKIHDQVGKELKGMGDIFKDLSPDEMSEMTRSFVDAAKYAGKELRRKFEDDEEFKKKIKGLR